LLRSRRALLWTFAVISETLDRAAAVIASARRMRDWAPRMAAFTCTIRAWAWRTLAFAFPACARSCWYSCWEMAPVVASVFERWSCAAQYC